MSNLSSDILIALLFCAVLFLVVRAFFPEKHHELKSFVTYGLMAKMLGSIAFALVYTLWYDVGDTLMYFKGAQLIHETFMMEPEKAFRMMSLSAGEMSGEFGQHMWTFHYFAGESEWLFARIAGVLNIFAFNSFTALNVIFGFIGFIGLTGIFMTVVKLFPERKRILFFAVYLAPSSLFWTSGLLKDSLSIGIIGVVIYLIYNVMYKSRGLLTLLSIGVLLWLLMELKPYLAFTFLLSLIAWGVFHFISQQRFPIISRILGVVMIGLFIFAVANLPSLLKQSSEVEIYQDSMTRVQDYQQAYSKTESGYLISVSDYSLSSVLSVAPLALTTALVRPFIWEANKPMLLLLSLENLIYIIGLIMLLIQGFANLSIREKLFSPFGVFSITFIVALGLVVGLICSNYGLLMRVRTPFIPFLGILISLAVPLNRTEPNEQASTLRSQP